MVYPPELLDRLQAIAPAPWAGQAFRHMFRDYPPDAENTRGARWNPAGVAAIYTSLAHEGVVAEVAVGAGDQVEAGRLLVVIDGFEQDAT